MSYSLELIMQYTDFAESQYIPYYNKKRNAYVGIEYLSSAASFSPDKHSESYLYVCTYQVFIQICDMNMLPLPCNCGMIVIDTDNQWNPLSYSLNIVLGKIPNDLIIIKEPEILSCINYFTRALRKLDNIVGLFSTAVCERQSLDRIVQLFYDLLGNPAYILDSSFKVLAIDKRNNMRELSATWKRLEDDGYLPYDRINNLIQSEELHEIENAFNAHMVSSRYFYTPFINYNLRKKGRLIGHLFVINMFRNISLEDIELVSLVGNYVAQAILGNTRYQNQRGQFYEYFLNDICSGRMTDTDNIRIQLHAMGYWEQCWYMIAMIHTSETDEFKKELLISHLERFRGCKPFPFQDYIAAIIPFSSSDTPDSVVHELKQLAERMGFLAGVSDTFFGFTDIYNCAQQALYAIEYLLKEQQDHENNYMMHASSFIQNEKAVGSHQFTVLQYEQCFQHHLSMILSLADQSHYLFPAELHVLQEYDRQNGTELLYTLKIYLVHERNTISAANALFIHRNTLNYRIRKIQELCYLDFDSPDTRMRILLALSDYSGWNSNK